MDLREGLRNLEEMKQLMDLYYGTDRPFNQKDFDRIAELYGMTEDLIRSVVGKQEIHVGTLSAASIHPDYISAGWTSGYSHHQHAGRQRLVKVIGRVKALISDPGAPRIPSSLDQLIQALSRFRECCQYITTPPGNERAVQDIVWIMLRAQIDDLEREETLPRFGAKQYRPDFGIPSLRTLIEVKYLGESATAANLQEELLADIPGYVNESSGYLGIIILAYDAAHKLRDARKFIEHLEQREEIRKVLVIPGIG